MVGNILAAIFESYQLVLKMWIVFRQRKLLRKWKIADQISYSFVDKYFNFQVSWICKCQD